MDTGFRFLPEQASSIAPEVDAVYFFLLGVTGFFTVTIASLIIYFAIKYRRGSRASRQIASHARGMLMMEAAWIIVPFVLGMIIFGWSAKVYYAMARPPAGALDIECVGRQWMWKFQHPEGNSEINELHVPRDQPVRIRMISEDVIHSLYVPAFRVKHDVLPNRYTALWFEASKTGRYHLFCAEYCGAKHAGMGGQVVVMEPSEYQAWLSGGVSAEPPAVTGQKLFTQLGCVTCHRGGGEASRGPPLENLYRSKVVLQNSETVVADEDYLRESILRPTAKVVAGYQPIMPSFEGQIGEEGILHLLAYIKSLSTQTPAAIGKP